MFNDRYCLTQAVLEGRKTQTRRIIKGIENLDFNDFGFYFKKDATQVLAFANNGYIVKEIKLPYQMGETVAIAQAYKDCKRFVCLRESAGWSNKMFVEASLMPHHIRITNVRVEKLPYISEKDCIAEGIEKGDFTNTWDTFFFREGQNYITGRTAWIAYSKLIDRVCGKGTWNSNSWVFVYEFELID